MNHILLVEDDLHLSQTLQETLQKTYHVVTARTLANAYSYLDKTAFDLVIIDRILPDGDAIQLIRCIHESHYQTRILAISRLYQPAEKIRGLEQGADDYLPKPFSLGELRLKVKKMLSYEKKVPQTKYYLKNMHFNPTSGELVLDETKQSLRKKEALILECLFKYKNRVISREQIIDEVWNNTDFLPTQTTLDVYIRRIRVVLGEYGDYIVTKRGFGYLLKDV